MRAPAQPPVPVARCATEKSRIEPLNSLRFIKLDVAGVQPHGEPGPHPTKFPASVTILLASDKVYGNLQLCFQPVFYADNIPAQIYCGPIKWMNF
jgi:hypothetical protein